MLLVGCGALGSVIAELLVRAGVGTLTIVDRDVVEESNLQRQLLFDEDDARRATPKAEAAKARLARINRHARVRAFHDDFGPRTARRYAEGVDAIVDGLDNLETRYLLNDLAVEASLPYIYGAAVGTRGMIAVIRPGRTPCLRCIAPEPPAPGTLETCESAGVLGAATALIASLEVAETLKLLVGDESAVERGLLSVDLWSGDWRRVDLSRGRDPHCPCCGQRNFEYLEGRRGSAAEALCGRNSVQIRPQGPVGIDLERAAGRLASFGTVERRGDVVRLTMTQGSLALEVHADGRLVVRGTGDPEEARSLVARLLGS